MKKALFIIFCALNNFSVSAQSTTGLVAHWDMNSTVNDISGNGHNGHANNLLPAPGIAGIPNTAYYFNGINSSITTAYAPDLNVINYTICATIKVMGFYNGACQVNSVFQRGPLCCGTATDQYALMFYDNPFDGDNCSLMDSTKDVFIAESGSGTTTPVAVWQYSPQIVSDHWYKAVATWDGTKWKVFVNDTLKSTVTHTAGFLTTGTDSISIGMDIFEPGTGNVNDFKGIIDDIQFYNRVLTDSEIHIYSTDSFNCGVFTAQPSPVTVTEDGNTTFTVSNNTSAPSYQWQENYGTGFVNLINVPPYSGVTTPVLTITGTSMSLNSANFRCIVYNATCADTSNAALLTVHSRTGVAVVPADVIDIFPNPANDIVTIQFPGKGLGSVQLINAVGQVILQQQISSETLRINVSSFAAGVYTLKAQYNGSTLYKKIIKK